MARAVAGDGSSGNGGGAGDSGTGGGRGGEGVGGGGGSATDAYGAKFGFDERQEQEEQLVVAEEKVLNGGCELAIVPFVSSGGAREAEEEEEAGVAYGSEGQAVGAEEEGKDGWEAARAWLWTLPRRRNVMYEEVEEWLQSNKNRLSREIVTMPRAHLFRFLVSQHKVMRRTEQKEKLELVEPPTARFKRSDKWRPIYAWLESLDSGPVVGAKIIDAWLTRNPAIKDDLLGKHTRHHLFHYIQKCHTNILKKRSKQILNGPTKENEEKKKKKKVRKVLKRELLLVPAEGSRAHMPDGAVLGAEMSQVQSRGGSEDGHGFIMQSHLELSKGKDPCHGQVSQVWRKSFSENGPVENSDAHAKDAFERSKGEHTILTSRTPEVFPHSNGFIDTLQDEAKNMQSLIKAEMKGDDEKPFFEDKQSGSVMDRAEARRRYEILSELRTQLWDQIVQTREQLRISSAQGNASFSDMPSTSAAPFPSMLADDLQNRPGSSGTVLGTSVDGQNLTNEDIEGRTRRRSRDSARLQQENGGFSLSGHMRSRSSVDLKFGKKRRKGKEKFDNVILSWAYSEVSSVSCSSSGSRPGQSMHIEKGSPCASNMKSQSGSSLERATTSQTTTSQTLEDEVTQLKMETSTVRCLQEREIGAGIGSRASPFQMVGRRRRRRWKSFLEGWDSLEKRFAGCAASLQQKAFSTWLPCWSAYTSSVAVAAPLGMMDQGVQKVLDVRFHPQNLPQLVCSSNAAPNELLLYDLVSGRATELVGHNCQIQAVEYVANGTCIVSCGSNLVKIWDSSSGACLHTLGPRPGDERASGHNKKINAMAVNHSQSCLVATSGGDGDSQLLLWNVHRGELACDLNRNLRKQYATLPCMDALEFCNQNLLICGSDSTSGGPAIVQIWDVNAPQSFTSFPANDSYITSLKTDPAGTTIASGAGDGSVALFDIRTCGGIVRLPLGSNCEVTSVSFSSCGTYFQASSTANRTLVWDIRMLPMDPGPKPLERPLELAYSASRKMRALHCLSHGTPMPTSENAGQMPGFVDEGDQGVNDARWFHDTSVLVTVSGNGSIAMWDMSLGDPCIRHLVSHTRCVNTVTIAPNDKYICSGGDDQKVVLYQNTREKLTSGWRLTHPLLEETPTA